MDKLRFLSLFSPRLINSIKTEHSCKICYVNNKVFFPFWAPEKDQNRFLGYKVLEGVLELYQGTKLFQYCTCPAGRVTYNSHLSCKHIHRPLKEYAIFFFSKTLLRIFKGDNLRTLLTPGHFSRNINFLHFFVNRYFALLIMI